MTSEHLDNRQIDSQISESISAISHPYHAVGVDEVIQRYLARINLYKLGRLHEDFLTLGLCPVWLESHFETTASVFFAEQLAPLPTLFANQGRYGTPNNLFQSLKKLYQIYDRLNNLGFNKVQVGNFALPDDGVTFSGINSLFHFFLPDEKGTKDIKAFRFHSNRERKELFGIGYKWLTFDRNKLEEICVLVKNLMTNKQSFKSSFKSASEDFISDINQLLKTVPSLVSRISFAEGMDVYNRCFVQRYFPGRAYYTGFFDHVSTFLTNGVVSWHKYVSKLMELGLVNLGDSLARLRFERQGKGHRYDTLVLSSISAGQVLVKGDNAIYNIEYLAEQSKKSLAENGYVSLVPTMISNYLIIYGMGNTICLVDGAPFRKAELLASALSSGKGNLSKQKLTTMGYTGLLNISSDIDKSPYDGLVPAYSAFDYYNYGYSGDW